MTAKKTDHRGEFVLEKIKNSEKDVSNIADYLGMSRTTLWRQLKKKELSFELIKRIEDVAKLGLSKDFPEIMELKGEITLSFKEKYYEMLHKHNDILEENINLRKRLAKYE